MLIHFLYWSTSTIFEPLKIRNSSITLSQMKNRNNLLMLILPLEEEMISFLQQASGQGFWIAGRQQMRCIMSTSYHSFLISKFENNLKPSLTIIRRSPSLHQMFVSIFNVMPITSTMLLEFYNVLHYVSGTEIR